MIPARIEDASGIPAHYLITTVMEIRKWQQS